MQKAQVNGGYTLVAIPTELVEAIGLCSDTGIQFSISRGRLVIEPTEGRKNWVCRGCCLLCPGRDSCINSCL